MGRGLLNFEQTSILSSFDRVIKRGQYHWPCTRSIQIWTVLLHFPVEQLQPGQKCPGSLGSFLTGVKFRWLLGPKLDPYREPQICSPFLGGRKCCYRFIHHCGDGLFPHHMWGSPFYEFRRTTKPTGFDPHHRIWLPDACEVLHCSFLSNGIRKFPYPLEMRTKFRPPLRVRQIWRRGAVLNTAPFWDLTNLTILAVSPYLGFRG